MFLWRGGTLRELKLASFHLLSHVGGEVIGESEGLEGMEMFETTAVGKEGHWEATGAESQTAELQAADDGLRSPRALLCFVFCELTLQPLCLLL